MNYEDLHKLIRKQIEGIYSEEDIPDLIEVPGWLEGSFEEEEALKRDLEIVGKIANGDEDDVLWWIQAYALHNILQYILWQKKVSDTPEKQIVIDSILQDLIFHYPEDGDKKLLETFKKHIWLMNIIKKRMSKTDKGTMLSIEGAQILKRLLDEDEHA